MNCGGINNGDKAQMNRPSFTIESWCSTRQVSRSMFYKLKAAGKAPRVHYAGIKPLISSEADAEWLRQAEAEANPASVSA
jgi:hypothetical protein